MNWLKDTGWPIFQRGCVAVWEFCADWWVGVDLHPGLHAASAILGATVYHFIRVYG